MVPRSRSLWLLAALALGAAAPRLTQVAEPSAFLDELLWLGEGARTVRRLADGPAPPSAWKRDLSHPGVLVALIGGWARSGRAPHTPFAREHARVLGRARTAIAVASILTVLAVFWLGAPLVGRRTAGLGAVLLAASPFHVAMGPWLECDSLLTLWTTVSLLTAARFLTERRIGWLVVCAIATGQAIVAKLSGVLLLPVLAGALVAWPTGRGWRELVRATTPLFVAIVAVVVYVSWPRIWLDPTEIVRVLAWGREVAEKGHRNFFLGTITRDPPWTYYLVVVPIRLGEVELAGLAGAVAIAIATIARRRQLQRPAIDPTLALLVVFAILWIVFFSTQPKKLGARYLLPIWPVIALLGGWTASRAIDVLSGARARTIATAAVVVLAAAQLAWTMAPVWPDRLAAYDRLLGGLARAVEVEIVGGGIVEKDLAAALDDLPKGAKVAVAAHRAAVAWHTRRRFGPLADRGLESGIARHAWDYLAVARYERVRRPILDRAVARLPIVDVVRRDGVDLAWVFRVP